MFDLQTEMHLRRAGRDDEACGARPGHSRMLLVLANVTAWPCLPPRWPDRQRLA